MRDGTRQGAAACRHSLHREFHDKATGIDLQRISLGALIIALGLLVDDAMTTVDVMTSRLAAGDSKEAAATFAYKTLAVPMLTGSFVTAAGFIPIGFARSSAGEYTFSIFAVVSYALILSWIVAVIFAPLLGVVLLSQPKAKQTDKPSPILGRLWALSQARPYRQAGQCRDGCDRPGAGRLCLGHRPAGAGYRRLIGRTA